LPCFFSRNSIFLLKKSANSIFQPAYNSSRTGPKSIVVATSEEGQGRNIGKFFYFYVFLIPIKFLSNFL
jgi:hypothetical protein